MVESSNTSISLNQPSCTIIRRAEPNIKEILTTFMRRSPIGFKTLLTFIKNIKGLEIINRGNCLNRAYLEHPHLFQSKEDWFDNK